jgi:hypothetical protein
MAKGIRKAARLHEHAPVALGELIHAQVRVAIETAVHEELAIALGAGRYERHAERRGYRNGVKTRTLTGPTGPMALTLPRATMGAMGHGQEWTSTIVPRYQRRMREVNEAVIATYLAGGNTRRICGALQPLLKEAPLSKSAVSRVIAMLKDGLEAWRTRSLADLDVIYVYLDGFALRVRSAGKVVSVPVLGVVGVLVDGEKQLLALELCGGESFEAWKGCLDDLAARASVPRCSASSTAMPGYGARSHWYGPEPRYSAAAYTSCGTSNVKPQSTRSRTFATTSIVSSMPPVARPPAPPSRPSSARGPNAAPASWRVCAKAATSF